MDRIFLSVLNMSLTASFVIVAVLLARFFLRHAPKIVSYSLWGVVLFNLLCPFKPESAFSLHPLRAEPISEQAALVPGQELSFVEAALYSLQTPRDDVYIPIRPAPAELDPSRHGYEPPYHSYLFGYQAYIILGSYLWPVGMAALLVYAVTGYLRLKRRVSLAVHIEENIYETDSIDTPFVLGLLRPRIYIPTGIEPVSAAYIIEHERAHIKRRDPFVSAAAFAALALHWFNPFVWLAYACILRDMESACDEAVLRKSQEDIRRGYSSALLDFASGKKRLPVPLAFGEQSVKGRIKHVLRFKKPPRLLVVVAVALVVVLSVGFASSRSTENDWRIPMAGSNLSDIQTEEVVRQAAHMTGALNGKITVQPYRQTVFVSDRFDWHPNTQTIHVSGDLDWSSFESAGIELSQVDASGSAIYEYTGRLRLLSEDSYYMVVEPARPEEPLRRMVALQDYMNALKYLPQETVRSLAGDVDRYMITLADDSIPDGGQPRLFYSAHGNTTGNSGEPLVRLVVQPMVEREDRGGYGSNEFGAIHLFYTDAGPENAIANVMPHKEETNTLDDPALEGGRQVLTLDDIRRLSALGENVTWDDFAEYAGRYTSDGKGGGHVHYQIEGGKWELRLAVTHADGIEILYAWLIPSGFAFRPENMIDIRSSDVDKYIRYVEIFDETQTQLSASEEAAAYSAALEYETMVIKDKVGEITRITDVSDYDEYVILDSVQGKLAAFSVEVKGMGVQRIIVLTQTGDGNWEVVNEGY